MLVVTLDLQRRRDLGEILSTCLSLYTKHFLLFAALALGVVVPADLVLYGAGAGQLWSDYDDNPSIFRWVPSLIAPTAGSSRGGGQVLADAVIYSFTALSATFLYFDLRTRSDAGTPPV